MMRRARLQQAQIFQPRIAPIAQRMHMVLASLASTFPPTICILTLNGRQGKERLIPSQDPPPTKEQDWMILTNFLCHHPPPTIRIRQMPLPRYPTSNWLWLLSALQLTPPLARAIPPTRPNERESRRRRGRQRAEKVLVTAMMVSDHTESFGLTPSWMHGLTNIIHSKCPSVLRRPA